MKKILIIILLSVLSLSAQKRISDLPAATSVSGGDYYMVMQNGLTKKVTYSAMTAGFLTSTQNLVFTTTAYNNPNWLVGLSAAKITGTISGVAYKTSANTFTLDNTFNGLTTFAGDVTFNGDLLLTRDIISNGHNTFNGVNSFTTSSFFGGQATFSGITNLSRTNVNGYANFTGGVGIGYRDVSLDNSQTITVDISSPPTGGIYISNVGYQDGGAISDIYGGTEGRIIYIFTSNSLQNYLLLQSGNTIGFDKTLNDGQGVYLIFLQGKWRKLYEFNTMNEAN